MARLSAERRLGRVRAAVVALISSLLVVGGSAAPALAGDPPPPLVPIDPQVVTQAADQTWADYHPIPGSPYADPTIEPSIERFNVALILTDFPDTPFVVTQPEGSTVFGNPGALAHDLPREAVPAFYRDWLNVPSAMNEFQGMNRYWMEDTYGKYGVALEGYGPYLLPGDQNEYFINDITGSNNSTCAVQTRTTTAQANVTDIEVVSTASFSVGKIVRGLTAGSGQSANTLNRVVTEIVDATHLRTGAASVLAAASAAGATNIKYANTLALQGLAVGDALHIGFDDRLEIRTIAVVGTPGSGGTGIDLDTPLEFSHAQNTILRDMTTSAITSVPADTFVNTCNRNYRTETLVAWTDHVSEEERDSYDNTFYVAAGQDESGTWQEFGEMVFTQDTVPDEFGPPNPEITQNWAATRYIPWTSWRSAATIWPSASGDNSVEGEGSGMAVYAHELTHNLGLPDNYNNPYVAPFQRAATGYWSMMSRGSFGGPGGTHNRWHIPSTLGTSLGSQHVIRDKIALGFVTPDNFVDLTRSALAATGLAVVEITARQVDPEASGQTGVRIGLDGGDQTLGCSLFTTTLAAPAALGDTTISVVSANNIAIGRELTVGTPANGERHTIAAVAGTLVTLGEPLVRDHAAGEEASNRLNCSGNPNFSNYTLEVTDQVGSDSFQADSGVLIEKNKNNSSSCGSFNCFAWIVDAHPEDINMVDFIRPGGTTQLVTTGDPRQLTDAAFHAGTKSGSLYEWEDTRNGLHFYILDRHVDEDGVLRYRVAVQNINGSGPQTRGVALQAAPALNIAEQATYCAFPLTNTGEAVQLDDTLHPDSNEAAYLNNDVYRLAASAEGAGWYAELPNALATAAFGETISVPVYVSREQGSSTNATIELTATSVSDPGKTSTATCTTSVQAQTVVAETINFLDALPSSGSQTNKRIADAIKELQASLASTYWTSEPCTLSTDGKGLFDQHKKAVNSLQLVTSPPELVASLLPYIQNVVQADRNLVVCTIAANADGDPAKLAAANQYLALGDSNYAAGLYKEAIDAYKLAWDEARKA
jgi:M6 family metalloprotease-like protein